MILVFLFLANKSDPIFSDRLMRVTPKKIITILGALFTLAFIKYFSEYMAKQETINNDIGSSNNSLLNFQLPSSSVHNPELAQEQQTPVSSKVNYNVHIFYYPWYGNPTFNNQTYEHWNHEYIPHWDANKARDDPLAG